MTQTSYTIWANNTGGSSSVTIQITINEPIAVISYGYNNSSTSNYNQVNLRFEGFDYDNCEISNDVYGYLGYAYSITYDMTTCNGIAVDFITATSYYESNGIFNSGTYEYSVYDQYNDGLDGGASVIFRDTNSRFN